MTTHESALGSPGDQIDLGDAAENPVHRMTATLLLVVAGLVSACSTPVWTSPPGSEKYQIGYHEGCDAGYAVAGSPYYERIESAEPNSQNIDYVQGWQEGFDVCKRSYDRIQATIHSVLGTGV